MPIKALCKYCKKEFLTYPSRLKRGDGKYCSRSCKDSDQKNSSVPNILIVKKYKDGLSCAQIAQKFNLSNMIVYRRLKEEGIKTRSSIEGVKLAYINLTGPNNPNFKSKRKLTRKRHKDYWLIYKPDYHRADKRGFVYEHIYIWEQCHEKPVPKGWHVHHKNGNSLDNRIENLEAMSASKHSKLHNELRKKELNDAKRKIKELEKENETLRNLIGYSSAINE